MREIGGENRKGDYLDLLWEVRLHPGGIFPVELCHDDHFLWRRRRRWAQGRD